MSLEENIKKIKHSFMAFRNGIISDTLRKAGMPYKIIFGLQLPQIAEIARNNEKNLELADALWQDSGVRESRLLACYLYPLAEVNKDKAYELASSVQTIEEADILSFRLLRNLAFADALANRLSSEDSQLISYCGKALRRNLDAMA